MTEYDDSPEAIAEYMAGYRRTADWVSRQRDFPHFSPSISPSIRDDTSEVLDMAESDAWSSKSLPPRMLLRYDDGRPDVPLNEYVAPPRQPPPSRRAQPPPSQPLVHTISPEPEEIRILPTKSSSSSTSIIPPRRERRSQTVSHSSGLPGSQALVGNNIPPYPQQIAVYSPAPRHAPPMAHAETHPPSRRSGAASTPPLPHPYRGPESQNGRSSSVGPSKRPPPVSYSQSHPANNAPHASYIAPSQHSRTGQSVQYQPTPPHTPHRSGQSRLDSRPASRQDAYLPEEYHQPLPLPREPPPRPASRHSRRVSSQPQTVPPPEEPRQPSYHSRHVSMQSQPPPEEPRQSSYHSRHMSMQSQQGQPLPTPPETPAPHERPRNMSASTSGRRPPVVVSTRASTRAGSQPPAVVYAPRSTVPMDAHYSPPPVVPRSAPADQAQFPSTAVPRQREANGQSRDDPAHVAAAAAPERGRRSVDHANTQSRPRSSKISGSKPPAEVPRRASTVATARTIESDSAILVDIPERTGRSRSQSVHANSRRRDKSNPRSESSASTYYVLASKGQKVHVIVPDDDGLYNPTPPNHSSPPSSRSPGSSQSHSQDAHFPVAHPQAHGLPPHLANRKAPSFLGRFFNSISLNGKGDRRRRVDSAPPAALDSRGRPITRRNTTMGAFRSRTPKVG